jgi:hypothetical protein
MPRFTCLEDVEMSGSMDDVDLALRCEKVASDYLPMMEQYDCPDNNVLKSELDDFEKKYLSGAANKHYYLRKRRNRKENDPGCSMLDIFRYMKEGLSNNEIATIVGVSPMFITLIKRDILGALKKYGISWKPVRYGKKRKRKRAGHGKNKVS